MADNLTSMSNNASDLSTTEPNTKSSDTISDAAYSGVLNGLCVLAAFTIISNAVVLIASKFTTAGTSATLVFIRSLCFADVVVGLFGIFKSILLNHLDGVMINCFLPESMFVSASTTLSLSLLWLNCDSYFRLTSPLGYGRKMDKSNIINLMMILWNFSFILGFMPQMGWNKDEYSCNMFNYYDEVYLLSVGLVWFFCMFLSCIFQQKLRKVRKQVLEDSHFLTPQSFEFRKYSKLIVTIRIDVIIWIISYVPLLIYLTLFCNSCSLGGREAANSNLFFFMPIFLIRSFISAFVHSYRTIKIQQVMKNMSRRLSHTDHKGSLCSVEGTTSNGSSNSSHSDKGVETVSKSVSKLGARIHKPLTVTSSIVTIESSLEDVSPQTTVVLTGRKDRRNSEIQVLTTNL